MIKMSRIKIQISSGQGPYECESAVGHYLKQLQKEYASLTVISARQGRYKETYSSVICELEEQEGEKKVTTGSILWICQSPYRKQHKRKNWYIDVSQINETHEISSEGEIQYQTFRSGGKGGQHVNKVETGVRAIHRATGLSVVATEARSQHMNKQIATNRLLDLLAQRNQLLKEEENKMIWMEKQRLERGNPVRIFKGPLFMEVIAHRKEQS